MSEQSIQVSQQEIIFIFFVVIFFLSLLVTFFFVIVINYYRTNARRQSDLLMAIVETQEKERNRIAIDMHDELGPLLSAVKLQVSGLKNTHSPDTVALMETQDLLDEAILQIRQIIRDLVPRNIDQKGLAGALSDLKQYFESFTPIKVNLATNGLTERFSLQSEINIYRIIQEIVNNAVKHANAEIVSISLNGNEQQLKIEVTDSGKGFDTATVSEGSGRKNIETRIRMNKGVYEISSAPGKGTSYFISFEKKKLVE